MRGALARVPPEHMPAVVPETISAQGGAGAARDQWHTVADALRERFQRLAELMDASRDDVLVYT